MSRGTAKRLLNRLGIGRSRLLLKFAVADTMGKSRLAKSRRLPALQADISLLEDIIESGEPYTLKALAVNGGDIMSKLGVSAGKNVGKALNYLLEKVMEQPNMNKPAVLLRLLEEKEYEK
jgi:hypothetical protein